MKMKKFLSMMLIAFILPFTAVSCSDDDDDAPKNPNDNVSSSIVGTWVSSLAIETHIITFNADGTGSEQYYEYGILDYSGSFTYTIDGNTIYAVDSDGDSWNVDFYFSNGNLILESAVYTRSNGNTGGNVTPTQQ